MSVKSATTRGLALPAQSKVVQIVYATTTTDTSSSSSTYADTTLTGTITPTSASNNILVMVFQNGCQKATNDTSMGLRLLRGATHIFTILVDGGKTGSTARNQFSTAAVTVLDSPATTSATTYKTQFNSQGNNASTQVQQNNSGSSIILIEVTP